MSLERKLNIALISRYYPPDPGGGLALYTQHIAREFARQGHNVTVLSATQASELEEISDEGVQLMRIPQYKVYQRSLTGATCLYNSLKISDILMALHQIEPFDVVHSPASFFESYVFGRFHKQALDIPLVVKFHENRETYERIEGRFKRLKGARRHWFKRFLRRVAQDADYLLGVSGSCLESTLDYLDLSEYQAPMSVSQSPININLFQPTLAPAGYFSQHGLSGEEPFIFYSGRLIHEKGLHLLVESFLKDLAEKHPTLRLAIAGEFDYRQPSYEATIKQMMASHPAASRVHFLGRIPYSEIPYWYSGCTVFAAPSFCEPFGRVFIEAMACEAPVIGFNSGGPCEFITPDVDGILVQDQNTESLSQALGYLLEQPEDSRRMGQKGREKVVQCFSTEKLANDLLTIYDKLAGRSLSRTFVSP